MSDQPDVVSDQAKAQQLRSRVRAALIAYFVLFNVLGALPSAGSPSPERLERPRERAELLRWSRLFDALGFELEPGRLKELYLELAAGVEHTRAALAWPIAWWTDLTQSHQSWRLFAMPHDRPSALEIVVSHNGKQELLYRSGDDQHAWGTGVLEYRRVRAAYKPSQLGPPGTYDGFAQRISERIFDEQPDVERVSVSLVRRHTTLPGDVAVAVEGARSPSYIPPAPERTSVITFTRAGRE